MMSFTCIEGFPTKLDLVSMLVMDQLGRNELEPEQRGCRVAVGGEGLPAAKETETLDEDEVFSQGIIHSAHTALPD